MHRIRGIHTTRRLVLQLSVALLISTILGLIAGMAYLPHTASANTHCTYPLVHQNTIGWNDDGSTHRGVRSRSMWVERLDSGNLQCSRVSSIYIATLDGAFQVESGWFDASLLYTTCGYQLPYGPEVFDTKTNVNGYNCHAGPSAVPDNGTYNAVISVWSPNANGDWNFGYDGNTWDTRVNVAGPMTAYPLASGERHDIGDIAWSDFQQLQYESNTGWHDWANSAFLSDNDPDYCLKLYGDQTHVAVHATGDC